MKLSDKELLKKYQEVILQLTLLKQKTSTLSDFSEVLRERIEKLEGEVQKMFFIVEEYINKLEVKAQELKEEIIERGLNLTDDE